MLNSVDIVRLYQRSLDYEAQSYFWNICVACKWWFKENGIFFSSGVCIVERVVLYYFLVIFHGNSFAGLLNNAPVHWLIALFERL